MRFVPIKNIEQQSVLALHRVRQGFVKARTAQANQIRGLLGEFEAQIKTWHRASDASCKLENIPGIGPVTASALVASVGNAKNFQDGRQLAAWLGLVPKQHSSGGNSTLLGISKRGDSYLGTLLIHGARSVIFRAQQKADKNARIVWALVASDRNFQADYTRAPATA